MLNFERLVACLALAGMPAYALDLTVASYSRPLGFAGTNGHAAPWHDGSQRLTAGIKQSTHGNHFELVALSNAQSQLGCMTCGMDTSFGASAVDTLDFDIPEMSFGFDNSGDNTVVFEVSVQGLTSTCTNNAAGGGTGWGVWMATVNPSTYAMTNITAIFVPTSCQQGVLHPHFNQLDKEIDFTQKYCSLSQSGASGCTSAETSYCSGPNASACNFDLWKACVAVVTYSSGSNPPNGSSTWSVGTPTCLKPHDLSGGSDMGLAQVGQMEPGGIGGTFSTTFSTNSTNGWHLFQSNSTCVGQPWYHTDIIGYNFGTGKLAILTNTGCNNNAWNEHAGWTPDGTQVVIASTGLPANIGPYVSNSCWNGNFSTSFTCLDWFVSNAIFDNATLKFGRGRRLTYFNVSGSPEYYGSCSGSLCGLGGGAVDFFYSTRPYAFVGAQVSPVSGYGWTTITMNSFATVLDARSTWANHNGKVQ